MLKLACCFALLCFAFIPPISGQINSQLSEIEQAQLEFDNGNYDKAIELSKTGVERARQTKNRASIPKGLDIIACSQISLKLYKEAAITLSESLQEVSRFQPNRYRRAIIYVQLAWLFRSQHKYAEALFYSQKALAETPEKNIHVLGEHYLNIGHILFRLGFDISAIIWL